MSETQHIKQLPEGWKWVKLGEVVSLLGDGLHGTPEYSEDGEYYFINGNNLDNDKIVIKENTKRVSLVEYNKYKKLLNDKTILVSINGTIGNIAFYNNEKVVLGKSACYFNVGENIEKKFIRLILQGQRFLTYAHNTATGSTIKNVSLKSMREFPIPLPPLPTQLAIVAKIEELFSELDKGIENLRTAQQQLKTYRQAVLKWAFEGRLTSNQKLGSYEDYGDQVLRIAAEPTVVYNAKEKEDNDMSCSGQGSENGELPEGWKWVFLGDVSKVSGGLTKNAKRQNLDLKLPFLRVGNVYFNHLDLSEIHTIGINTSEIERVRLEKDDLLFVEGNGSLEQIGRVALWNGAIENCVHQNHLIKSRLSKQIIPKYALYYFCSLIGRDKIKKQANSTSGLHTLSLGKISKLEVPLCKIEEQVEIVQEIESRFSVADKMEESITQSLKQADALRQSILKRAFEGSLM